ncbi:MAG: TIGR03960 family B12-binding radical SAM protein [Polyangiaceae bacterium]
MTSSVQAEHPYAHFVHRVQKPARYIGGEFGAVKKDWNGVKARVCLAFPDVYDIGMSHLGFKILYKILNDDPRTLAERCYCPWIDMQAELRARNLPLVSLENAKKLSEFDVVGFSLQFELTYTNILTMLDLGGVALRSADRNEDAPLVIAGGPTATHPEPLAPFIDAFVIGDGEERATDIALAWVEMRDAKIPRAERLRALAKMRGVYVPVLYSTRIDESTGFTVVSEPTDSTIPFPVGRALVDDLNKFPFPDDGPIGGPEAIFDRMSIEIARGCTEGCRFCQAGMIYRPVRERDADQIVETVLSAVKKSGQDEVSLTSLSTADYSSIAPLIQKVTEKLAPQRVSLGVSSLRAYGLEEAVMDDMQKVRASGVTFAPEAGTQRMRDVVNKNVTEEQLMVTAERVFSRGWTSMKLYFMIGLPTEQEEDVREIPRVGGRARLVGKKIKQEKGQGPPAVTVSVSTHVPKPHTPFQWCAMDDRADVKKKQGWLREEAKRTKVDLRMHDSEGSWLEGVFARGDRSLANVLERAYRAGARFDSWDECLDVQIWRDAFAQENIEIPRYLGTIPTTARLPWDHIDVGLEEGFLAREYRKAVASRLSPPCGKAAGEFVHHTNLDDAETDSRKLVCYDCGVACDLSAMRRERLVQLTKLGARSKRVADTEPPVFVKPAARHKKGVTPMAAAPGFKYRFAFTKVGPSTFLSHLDLIRALPRAFRRNDLNLCYSNGFHPKPDLTFGPALSLGVMSLDEFVDVKLSQEIEPNSWLAALSESAPEGIEFTAGRRLVPGEGTIARAIDTARYAIIFSRAVLAEHGGDAWLAAEVARFENETEHVVFRKVEGVGKKVDVRAFVRSISVNTEAGRDAVARAGMVGDLAVVMVDVAITVAGSAKISEVAEAIAAGVDHRAVRVALGTTLPDGEIFSPIETAPAAPSAGLADQLDAQHRAADPNLVTDA